MRECGMGTDDYANQARAWAIALNIVYGTLGFGAMGFAIDYFAGTSPLWLLVLGGIGLVVGTYRFIREALELNRTAGRPGDGRPGGGGTGSGAVGGEKPPESGS